MAKVSLDRPGSTPTDTGAKICVGTYLGYIDQSSLPNSFLSLFQVSRQLSVDVIDTLQSTSRDHESIGALSKPPIQPIRAPSRALIALKRQI